MQDKTIVIAGGAGFIGQALCNFFGLNNQVIILTRGTGASNNSYHGTIKDAVLQNVKYVKWDANLQADWSKVLDGADMVINLTGQSVNCRYTTKNKQEIYDSRTQSTNAIGEAIRNAKNPPQLWINAASATIYRNATDRPQDEFTGDIGEGFSVDVCKRWEEAFFANETSVTRKIALRMAIAIGPGGVMVPYCNLVKFGLGGRQGSGGQMYSWVHITDVCRMMESAYNTHSAEGIYNCSSPNPVTNKFFMQTLHNITGCNIGLPAYKWMLAIGAAIIGTETELILKSRWVVPTRSLRDGFIFQYPLLRDALVEVIAKIPRSQYRIF